MHAKGMKRLFSVVENKTPIINAIWLQFAHHTQTDQTNRRALSRRLIVFYQRSASQMSLWGTLSHTHTHTHTHTVYTGLERNEWARVKGEELLPQRHLNGAFSFSRDTNPIPQTELVINQTWTAHGGHYKPAWRYKNISTIQSN